MKTKLLLIYGYILPFVASAVISLLPWFFNYDYKNIAQYFSQHLEILLALLAVFAAITFPFQTSIINEDNPHILAVLEKSNVRIVFVRASIFQATFILCATLLILIISANTFISSISGYLVSLASALITFESVALISNGRAYGSIREKIIVAVNKEEKKNGPPTPPDARSARLR